MKKDKLVPTQVEPTASPFPGGQTLTTDPTGPGQGFFMVGTILLHTEQPLGCTRKGAGGENQKGNSAEAAQDFQAHGDPWMALLRRKGYNQCLCVLHSILFG